MHLIHSIFIFFPARSLLALTVNCGEQVAAALDSIIKIFQANNSSNSFVLEKTSGERGVRGVCSLQRRVSAL